MRTAAATERTALPHLIALVSAAAIAGCATSTSGIERRSMLDDASNRSLFVVAASHRRAAVEALSRAGFTVVEDLLASPHYLRVVVGVQKNSVACGSLHNVKYDLRQKGRSAVALTRSGWIGHCQANVFEQLAQELSELFDRAAAESTRNESKTQYEGEPI